MTYPRNLANEREAVVFRLEYEVLEAIAAAEETLGKGRVLRELTRIRRKYKEDEI